MSGWLIAAVLALLGFFAWRDFRRGWTWPGGHKDAANPSPPAQEVLPPLPVDSRPVTEQLQALSASLETKAEQSAHPRDLLLFADFRMAVEILADPRCDLELVRHYAAGRLWTLSCAAFEALRRRPDRQKLADLGLGQLRTHSPGALHYALRFLNSLDPRAPSGDPVTIADQWWSHHAMLIETFRDYFAERQALGDPPQFGALIQAPDVELEHVEAFLKRVDHPYASALLGELERVRAVRVDEAKLTAFGRFWSREPGELLVEPEPWRAALEETEAAVTGAQHRSILVTGPPRVGKSSFLRLLGKRLADEGWRVFEATASELMADQMYVGQLEGRIRETVAELKVGKKVAWCVGDLQQLARSGTHSGQSASILDQMWPAIAAGRLLILAEADPDGASRTLQMRPALSAHLEVVRLHPFDEDQLAQFAGRVADRLQARVQASIGPVARDAALHYAQQYLRASDAPGAVADVLKRAADRALAGRDGEAPVVVGAEQVIEAVAQMTGLPADILDEDDPIDLGQVRAYFTRKVMGQDHAVSVVVDRIAMLKAGLVDPNKPIGVFLFAGPTGTGKTELAKTLAAFLFGSAERLVRLDMSEFQSAEAVSKIVGERGSSSVGDPLVERVRKQPFSVVLLDEFEKAHSNVWDLFLQVFDDGRLTDANGHTADFRHAIIILTSNLGATSHRSSGMGFNPSKTPFADYQVVAAIEKAFRPEFVNRLDRVVVFQPLTRELLYRILHKELAEVLERRGLRNREWAVEWEPSALDFLLDRGFSPELGARPLKRAIDQYLLAPLAATLVEHRFPQGDQFLFVRSNGKALEVEFVDPDGAKPAPPPAATAAEAANRDEQSLAELVLHPAAASDSRDFLLRRCAALEAELESAPWLQRKARLEQRASAADIWDSPDRVAVFSALNLIDRVKEASSTVKRLGERLKPGPGQADRRSPDLAGRLALQLWLVEQGLQDVVSGAPGEAALMVESALEGTAEPAEAQAWVRRVLAMYGTWAEQRRMQFRLLTPAGQTPVLSVSGFGAWRTLSAEAGLHVLEAGAADGRRLTARVRVCEEPADEAQPSHATLLRALKGTPSGRQVVRRYRDGEAPLARDTRSGKRSGQLDLVLGGAFDLVFETDRAVATASAEY